LFLFFEARGYTWALPQSLEALEMDFAPVLQDKNAIVSVKQIVRELENTQNIILSPAIMNGTGFGAHCESLPCDGVLPLPGQCGGHRST
jgi:hypothetical protein